MGGIIEYCGKVRAEYNLFTIPDEVRRIEGVVKHSITFETLGDLELLLALRPNEVIIVDGESMPVSDFRQEILANTHRIYPTREQGEMGRMKQTNIEVLITELRAKVPRE